MALSGSLIYKILELSSFLILRSFFNKLINFIYFGSKRVNSFTPRHPLSGWYDVSL